MIDFTIPDEIQELRSRVHTFVEGICLPAEEALEKDPPDDLAGALRDLQRQARDAGLWCPHMPQEWGGMGLDPLANAIIQIDMAGSKLAARAMNTDGPEDATMLTILEHGTPEQKEKFLRPLVDGTARMCFSMTEKAAGSDATGMRTAAILKDGRWVMNGEKWFSSAARVADFALVMAKTEPDAPRHKQFSMFFVELPAPGFNIIRDIPVMGHRPVWTTGHAEIDITDLELPPENLLGTRGDGFQLGQHRLGYGRLRHGCRNIGLAQRALDMATARAVSRETFGSPLSERQGIQWMLADCATELYIARLMVLHIAYKMENHLDLRQENSMAKVFLANMIHKVVDTALQIHGSLGYTHDTPLATWYTTIRAQRLADGPDEVHRWTVGRNLIRAFERDGTTALAAGGDLV